MNGCNTSKSEAKESSSLSLVNDDVNIREKGDIASAFTLQWKIGESPSDTMWIYGKLASMVA